MQELAISDLLPGASIEDAIAEAAKLKEERDDIGRNDFLTMLVAQLKHQDPLNPADSSEFSAQLAQFSSLEQLVAMRESMDTLRDTMETMVENQGQIDAFERHLQMIELIGSDVTAVGNQVEVTESGDIVLPFGLADDADSFKLTIRDGNLPIAILRDMGTSDGLAVMPEKGPNDLIWDGLGADGQRVPPGTYSFEVEALSRGDVVEAEPVIKGTVTGTSITEGVPMLRVGTRYVQFGDVFDVDGRARDAAAGS